jgi:hypothetical protein
MISAVTAIASPTETSTSRERCANCGGDLTGRFCSECGQRAAHLRPTLHDFWHEAVHEFLHVDGKIFRTMKLLAFSPGTLTREFNSGRRAAFVSPIRLYLIWSVIFFALMAIASREGTALKVSYKESSVIRGVQVEGAPSFEKKVEEGVRKAQRNPKLLTDAIASAFPKSMFILMPLFAVLLLLLFRRREPLYIPHLYASIHLHAFAFFLFSIAVTLRLSGVGWLASLGTLLVLLVVPYFFLALKKMYEASWLTTIFKGVAVGAVYLLVLTATMLVIVLYSVVTI